MSQARAKPNYEIPAEFDLSLAGLEEILILLKDLLDIPCHDRNGSVIYPTSLVDREVKRLMEAYPGMTCKAAYMVASKRFAPAKIALALCRELMRIRSRERKEQE